MPLFRGGFGMAGFGTGGAAAGGSAPTIVNAWKSDSSTTGTAATVSPTTGNLLVAFIFVFGAGNSDTTHAISDNQSGTWTKIAGRTNASSGACRMSMWYQKNCAAGITTITPASGASGGGTVLIVHEVSGASTTAPFTGGEFGGFDEAGSVTNTVTTAVTNATANSLFFAGMICSAPGNPVTMTVNSTGSTNGTWSLFSSTNSQEQNSTGFLPASVANASVSTSASTAHGWAIPSSVASSICACFHA